MSPIPENATPKEGEAVEAPAVPRKRMAVTEAQDAMAATFAIFEELAWRFFVIARDLDAGERSESFPYEEPGPDHLRWFTANAAHATYYDLLETRERVRKAVERNHTDLVEEWQLRQARAFEAEEGSTPQ